ncbi:hypothetical protein STW0522ENT66_13400 [Enterobacter roggenkampii]|nr:hypothetical protein STW0522ENT66_13400 [Enterobacter roggenkampii]SAE88149.1 Uncharacterised protein [Enterobacter roggenkampii]
MLAPCFIFEYISLLLKFNDNKINIKFGSNFFELVMIISINLSYILIESLRFTFKDWSIEAQLDIKLVKLGAHGVQITCTDANCSIIL